MLLQIHSGFDSVQNNVDNGGVYATQVWRDTEQLSPYRDQRFKLTLNDDLADVFHDLAKQALDLGIDPTAWLHRGTHYSAGLVSEKAYERIKMLQFKSDIPRLANARSIGSIPLIETADGLVHDPDVLPLLPPSCDRLWMDGPMAGKPRPKWSKFYIVDFGNAQTLLREVGPHGGIYHFWLSRSEQQADGSCRKVVMTELYVGSAGQSCAHSLHGCIAHLLLS